MKHGRGEGFVLRVLRVLRVSISSADEHAAQDVVALDEVMAQRRRHVDDDHDQQQIGEELVRAFDAPREGGVGLREQERDRDADHLTARAITTVNVSNFLGVSVMQIVPGWILGGFTAVNGHPPEAAYRTMFAVLAATLAAALLIFLRWGARGRN